MRHWLFVFCLMLGILPLSAQTDSPLPPVIPTDNPTTLNAPTIVWDWEAYLADKYWRSEGVPDPLSLRVPDVYAGNMPALPIDPSQVAWVDELGLNDAQLALLAQNGFIVVPSDVNFFDEAYLTWNNQWDNIDYYNNLFEYRPFWVTTDALLHTLYLNFENLLKFVELDYMRSAMSLVLSRSYTSAYQTYQSLVGTPLEAQAKGAVLYLAVALGLFNNDDEMGGYWIVRDVDIREEADAIIATARNAVDVLNVPFLAGYQEDFSQYKPRGHYDTDDRLSDYFRGMMWLGRITFLAKDDNALISSFLVLKALAESGEYQTWAEIGDFITFLIGEEDNLGPRQYLPLVKEIFGDTLPPAVFTDPQRLATFRERLALLSGPKIANVVTDPQNIPTPEELLADETRGFRFFGQRFTFDAYVLQNLVNPFVGENANGQVRPLPSALDVATVLGSDVAYSLLEARGETGYDKFIRNMTLLRDEVNGFTPDDWMTNIYGGWLWTLQPLFVRRAEAYPPMMDTRAWYLRDLQAGLGSYTELKHATVLYTAQPSGRGGGGEMPPVPPTSFVEPNPYVFSRIAVIATALQPQIRAFAEQSPDIGNNLWTISSTLQSLSYVSAKLAHIAQKQLVGEALNEEDLYFIKFDIGTLLNGIRNSLGDLIAPEDLPPFSAVVTDIANNPDIEAVLQIGTGRIDYIYVVTTADDGRLQLARGAVYSFYEFTNDINNRLTDTQWRDAITAGQIPPRPEWVSEFMGQP